MKVLLSVILVFLIIIFFPIPFKLKISISNEDILIKLYRFTILKKSFKNTHDNLEENTTDEAKKINKKRKEKKKNSLLNSLSSKGKIKLITSISDNKFKPNLYLQGFLKYSLNDAAKTAVSFGMIHTYAPIIPWALRIIFKIKKFKFPISPIFKDSFIIISEINCIITISIAKTIFIVILLINNYINIKGDELEREKI